MKTRIWKSFAVAALVALVGLGSPAIGREPIDLNTASEAELVELPGIGPAKAKAIVAYRSEHRFEKVDEILNVPGIGPSTFAELEGQIVVGGAKGSN